MGKADSAISAVQTRPPLTGYSLLFCPGKPERRDRGSQVVSEGGRRGDTGSAMWIKSELMMALRLNGKSN